jgi:hypothetical protein
MEDRNLVERSLVAQEMSKLEHAFATLEDRLHATHIQQLQARSATHHVQATVTKSEVAALEAMIVEARTVQRAAERTYQAHVAILADSLSSLEIEELAIWAPAQAVALPLPDVSQLRHAVTVLEYLLDADMGAPAPSQPVSAAPDQLCAQLLDAALRQNAIASPEGQMVIARAVRALGRRASGIAMAMHELDALHLILESEIHELELLPAAPNAALGAGG